MVEEATTDTSKTVKDPAPETGQGKRLSGFRDSLKSDRNVGTGAIAAAIQDDDDDKVYTSAFNCLFIFIFIFIITISHRVKTQTRVVT